MTDRVCVGMGVTSGVTCPPAGCRQRTQEPLGFAPLHVSCASCCFSVFCSVLSASIGLSFKMLSSPSSRVRPSWSTCIQGTAPASCGPAAPRYSFGDGLQALVCPHPELLSVSNHHLTAHGYVLCFTKASGSSWWVVTLTPRAQVFTGVWICADHPGSCW